MNRLKENLISLNTLIRKEVVRFFRIWTQTLLPPVISMALYFLIFGNIIGPRIGKMGGQNYIDYIVPGLIMMSIITNAYSNVVASFFGAKFQRNIEEMLVSPMPVSIILWGYTLGGMLRGLVVGLLVMMVAAFFTELQLLHAAFTLFIALLASTLFSFAGLINGIFAKKFDDINFVPTFILSPLTYLGGIFYSIDILPKASQTLTYANPIFYMVNAFRYGMLGQSDVAMGTALGVTVGCIILLYVVCLILLKRGIGIKT